MYYGSYLVFPYVIWLIWRLYRQPRVFLGYVVLLGCLLFAWARFVEPQMITIQETQISGTLVKADIALISDIHIGVYKSPGFVERVVDQLNQLSVEAVYLAGDILYKADEQSLMQGIGALSKINKPVYAVLGNHDYLSHHFDHTKVRAALEKHGIRVIEQKIIDRGSYRIAGLGDHWHGNDSDLFLRQNTSEKPTLLLAHNPDSAMQLTSTSVNLVLSGHTHCGQVRIPWLYRLVIPTDNNFDCGLDEVKMWNRPVKIFITPGLGEIALPMRLFNPPRIDVLHLSP